MRNKHSLLILLIFSAVSFPVFSAHHPGPYIGIQGGIGLADEGNGYSSHLETFANNSIGNKSFEKSTGGGVGRVFLGYNFNKYFSIESGYALFANNDYTYNNSTLEQYLDIEVRTYTIDFLGKLILPFREGKWNLYAKFGGAYVHDDIAGTVSNIAGYSSNTKHYHAFCPAYSLGGAYSLNENFNIDLSWIGTYSNNRFMERDTNPDIIKPVPITNAIMLGLTYKFTAY